MGTTADTHRVPQTRVTKTPPAHKAPAKKGAAPAKKGAAPAKKGAAPAKKAVNRPTGTRAASTRTKATALTPAPRPAPKKRTAPTTKKSPTRRGATARPAPAPARRTTKTTPPQQMAPAPPLSRALRDLHAQYRDGLAPVWDPYTGLTTTIKVPASVALAPVRTRCRACRTLMADLVVLRMYCSYRCAGLPEPVIDVAAAPRQCKRAARSDEHGEWAPKNKYETVEQATPYVRGGTQVYRCANCFFLHIGNASPPPQRGLPPVATGNGGLFEDCVAALLKARGEDPTSAPLSAAAKRDVRTVFEVLQAHKTR